METFLIRALQLIMSLSLLVIVHEGGHFLFARLFKTRVEKFCLFFDPWFTLFKFKPKHSDTEYGIGWLPLGGYVKIAGMIDESMDTEQMKQPMQPWEFRAKPAWQRLLIMVGGALYPVPNADEVKKANVEGAIDAATVDDTLYAYPMTADNGYFLYYNKKYLSDSDVKTLDGILKAAEKNHKKFMMDWSSGWYLYSFFGNTGLDFGINDDNVTNHCDWNSTEGDIKGVDIAQAMLDISSSSGFENAVNEDFIKGAKKGSVIAGVSGVWSETELKKIWGDDIGAAKLPTYTVAGKQVQMASFTGYKLMGVSAYSANPQWAAKLADWLTNEQNQTVRFEMNGQGPSNTKAADSDAVKASPSIQAVIAQSEFGKLQRVGNSYWDASMEFGNTMAAGTLVMALKMGRMEEL